MKSVKFRGWDAYNLKWVDRGAIRIDGDGKIFTLDPDDLTFIKNVNLEISRSTTLRDKEGVEIFEGDIIEINRGFGDAGRDSQGYYSESTELKYFKVIKWINTGLNWEGSGLNLVKSNTKYFKVIGNIYEHPYLRRLYL